MDIVEKNFITICNIKSDINEHLFTLFLHAQECESIIELGVRSCISSWAFVAGLLHNNKSNKNLLLNDLDNCDNNINYLLQTTKDLDINIKYEWINDLELNIEEPVDLVFIDTWHVYGQLKRELNKFGKLSKKYIIMHDTTVDAIYGETIRNGLNATQQSIQTGIPVNEINCGLWKAIEEFLENNAEWKIKKRYTNNNGLTILEKI